MRRPFPLLLLLACAQCSVSAASPPLEWLEEQRFGFAEAPRWRVDRLALDDQGRLHWDASALDVPAIPACEGPPARRLEPPERRVVMLDPRVDERRCPGDSAAWLFGFDASGALAWKRPLVFVSGEHRIAQRLVGATPEGLVLSSLEVWSPATGKTLVPARTHRPDSGRKVPDHHVTGAAIYDPVGNAILYFTADVTLVRRKGGLYRFDLATGAVDLLRPVSASWLGTHDNVEGMAIARRWLFLARRNTVRGVAPVSLAVFDLDRKRYIFEQRFSGGHDYSEPRVVLGPDGVVAFSYRNANNREHVAVRFRMRP